jgi:hypothetical protein
VKWRREFQKAAAIAKRNDAISSGEVAELMVFATKYFIQDQKEAAAFFASRMMEEKRRNEPTHILKNAIEQVEEINDELDSWGDSNGRP